MRRCAEWFRSLLALAVVALVVAAGPVAAEEPPFDVLEIASTGRSLTVEIADLNGDGLGDLLQFTATGIPPDEVRTLRVYTQTADGIPTTVSFEMPIPAASAAYDLADVIDAPGIEILLLRPDGITILSLADVPGGEPRQLDLSLPAAAVTVGAAEDERGLDRIEIATHGLGDEPWLMVPGLGEVFFLASDGALRARIGVGGRANYFIQPPGPTMVESDIQLYFDAPRIAVGDVDGDGRADIVSASRHELRIFPRREDGSFEYDADRRIPLHRVTAKDHMRGSGSVRTVARDIDGDGLLDLLISETSGGLTDASAKTSIFFNRAGHWDLAQPDVVYASDESVTADQLIDLDGVPGLELVHYVVPINVLELVEIFVTQAIDANLYIYGANGDRSFQTKPLYRRKLDIPLDFETSRSKGFIPSFEFDLNGDGRRDYLNSGDGDEIEIFLASDKLKFDGRDARQSVPSEGAVRGGDLNGDGLTDLVIFNSRRLDAPIYVATNRGILPGTPPRSAPLHPRVESPPANAGGD